METITNPEIQNLPPITPQNNNYRILFFVSLGLLLIIGSVLATLLITQKSSNSTQTKPTGIEETEIIPTQSVTSEVTGTEITPTTSELKIPSDWKTYINETYKYSIKKPPSWGYDPQSIYKNEASFYVPSMDQCHHRIFCYKIFDEYKDEFFKTTRTQLDYSSLENYITDQKNKDWKFISKTKVEDQIFYKTKTIDMVGSTSYFIENNQNNAFCRIDLCNNDSTEDNLFIFSFKFN